MLEAIKECDRVVGCSRGLSWRVAFRETDVMPVFSLFYVAPWLVISHLSPHMFLFFWFLGVLVSVKASSFFCLFRAVYWVPVSNNSSQIKDSHGHTCSIQMIFFFFFLIRTVGLNEGQVVSVDNRAVCKSIQPACFSIIKQDGWSYEARGKEHP